MADQGAHRNALRVALLAQVVLIALGAGGGEEQPLVVAVVPFSVVVTENARPGAINAGAKALEDALQAYLSENNGVRLVERSAIDKALSERALSSAGLTESTAAQFGNWLHASVLIVGTVRGDEKQCSAAVRAIECANAKVVWAAETGAEPALLAARAGALADDFVNALQRRHPAVTAAEPGQSPLTALKHHERATALRTQKAYTDAVGEELLALERKPDLYEAESGLWQALEDAGFPQLARATAQDYVTAHPKLAADALLQRMLNLKTPEPAASETAVNDSGEVQARKQIIAWLAEEGRAGNTLALRDGPTAWLRLGDCYRKEARDRLALGAYKEAALQAARLRAIDARALRFNLLNNGEWRDMPAVLRIMDQSVFARLYGRSDSARAQLTDFSARGGTLLIRLLKQALADGKPAWPPDLLPPQPTFTLELPVRELVQIPAGRRNSGYIFQIDWDLLPRNAIILDINQTNSRDWPEMTVNARFEPLQDKVVAAEADEVYACKGCAWIDAGGGRDAQLSLTDLLNQQLRRSRPAPTIRWEARHIKPNPSPLVFWVSLALPAGADPGKLQTEPMSELEQAVFWVLKGERENARKRVQALKSAFTGVLAVTNFLSELDGLCEPEVRR